MQFFTCHDNNRNNFQQYKDLAGRSHMDLSVRKRTPPNKQLLPPPSYEATQAQFNGIGFGNGRHPNNGLNGSGNGHTANGSCPVSLSNSGGGNAVVPSVSNPNSNPNSNASLSTTTTNSGN